MRAAAGPAFEEALRSLMVDSEEFRTLWIAQHTAPLTPERIRLLIPEFGEVTVSSTRLSVPGRDDYLIVLLPPAAKASAVVMDRLSQDNGPRPALRGTALRGRRRRS